jgi:peptidoglycan/LPS O-acetylase OafA/YrhL
VTSESTATQASVARLDGIEALRCIAALMIVVYHTVELPQLSIPSYLNPIRTHFGLGVPLFYTLSGFVLAYGYVDRLGSRRQVLEFYVRRFFRIAPLFYLMLGLWILVSEIKWDTYEVALADIVLNLSLLFGLVPGKHESIVWAGWSIGIEMLFYGVFPIFALVFNSVRATSAAFCVSLFVSSMTYQGIAKLGNPSFAYMNLVTHLPFFLSGMFAHAFWRSDAFRARRLLGNGMLLGVVLAAVTLIYVRPVFDFLSSFVYFEFARYSWAVVFAALILAICYSSNPVIVNRVTRWMGQISFSLYLLHPMLILFLLDTHKRVAAELGNGTLGVACCVLLSVATVSVAASITYALIEKPGMGLGKRIGARFAENG